jgi:hypothetical protein
MKHSKKKCHLVFAILSLLIFSNSFAQKIDTRIDTLQLNVYYVKYLDGAALTNKSAIDVPFKTVIVPTMGLTSKDIPYLRKKQNNFNGIFLTSVDDLISMGSVIAQKSGKNLSDFATMMKKTKMPNDFRKHKSISSTIEKVYNIYESYDLDAQWIKYTIDSNSLTASDKNWVKKYNVKVGTASDGKSYNFYLLQKINSYKAID